MAGSIWQEQCDKARKISERLERLVPDQRDRVQYMGARLDLFAALQLLVRTKDGGALVPFVFNPIQMDYLRSLRARNAPVRGLDRFEGIRDAIVKPRQLGFSTMIAALYLMGGLAKPGTVTVVLSHDRDISEILLTTYRTFFEHLHIKFKEGVSLDSDSKYEFEVLFPGDQALRPPSRFVIDTEAGHPWRGGVIHQLHASEAAFYRNFPSFMASYVQAVPLNGNILLETTANGQNDYYREVQKALDGNSPYAVIYYPWWKHPEYKRPWLDGEAPTAEETALMVREGLSLQQIAWRRAKQQELGALFPQEYPESLLGAFLSTGRPFFDAITVAARHKAALELRKTSPPKAPRAHVEIWEDAVPGEQYLICADVAEGIDAGVTDVSDPERGGADFCAAYVIKIRTLSVVAAIHGRLPPIQFARLLMGAGRRYGWACLAVERNNHGHSILNTLESANYPQVYRHLEYDQGGTISYLKPGFPTTTVTRSMILDALDENIRSGALRCPDDGFWREASTFHRNPNGKPEALDGCHDDRVMALAIGVYLTTLGRSAWGLPALANADAAGFPKEALMGDDAPQTSSPLGMVPALIDPLTATRAEDLMAGVQAIKAIAKANTCGACMHYDEARGSCKPQRFLVNARDPGCTMYYPAYTAESLEAVGPIDGEVSL